MLFTGVSLVAFDQLSGCATKIVMLVHVFIVSDSCYKIFLGHTSYTLNLSSLAFFHNSSKMIVASTFI